MKTDSSAPKSRQPTASADFFRPIHAISRLHELFRLASISRPRNRQPARRDHKPILANIHLDPLDGILESQGLHSVRYADDIVVLAADADTAGKALRTIRGWMEGAGLKLHPEKTRMVDMREADPHIDYLGSRFQRSKRGEIDETGASDKQAEAAGQPAAEPTKRSNAHGMVKIVARINPILIGWYGYFQQARPTELTDMVPASKPPASKGAARKLCKTISILTLGFFWRKLQAS